MPSRVSDTKGGTTTTTDTSEVTLYDFEVPDNVTATIVTTLNARKTTNGTAAGFFFAATVKRHGGSDASRLGLTVDLLDGAGKDLGAALWSAKIDAEGAKFRVRVKAEADVDWGGQSAISYTVSD